MRAAPANDTLLNNVASGTQSPLVIETEVGLVNVPVQEALLEMKRDADTVTLTLRPNAVRTYPVPSTMQPPKARAVGSAVTLARPVQSEEDKKY